MRKPFISLRIFGIVISLCTMVYSTSAQFTSVPSIIKTPYGNVHMSTKVYSPEFYRNWPGEAPSHKYEFTVVLKDDSQFKGKGKINIKDSIQSLTLQNDSLTRVFLPVDTKEIFRMTKSGKKVSGSPMDSLWLFKTATGRINFYAFVAEPGTLYISAIEKDNSGEIVPYYEYYVKEMVADNEKALKLARKGKLYEALLKYNADEKSGLLEDKTDEATDNNSKE